MYLHVKINEKYQCDFGFAIKVNGETQYYFFVVVPFGLESATELMATLIKPYKFYVHNLGLDLSCYIDDMIQISVNCVQGLLMHNFIMDLVRFGGWEVNTKKSSVYPQTELLYLGFELDTVTMRVTAPIVKIIRLCKYIDELFTAHKDGNNVACRFLARILGNVTHLLQSHGNTLRICSRASQHALGCSTVGDYWDGDMEVTKAMAREMSLMQYYLHRLYFYLCTNTSPKGRIFYFRGHVK